MAMRTTFSIFAVAAVLTLSGCGGGGGGSSGSSDTGTSVSVAASLGRFSQGTPVVVKDATGTQIGTGSVGANGKASISVGSYTGVIVVEIHGGAGVTYFDEGTNTNKNFPEGRVLRAVSAQVMSEVAVTALTNAAAELTGNNLDATTVAKNNLAVAQQFGLANILAAPVMLDDTSGKITPADGDAGNYALILAALAQAASSSNIPLDQAMAALASDMQDGVLDGQNNGSPVDGAVSLAAINASKASAITTFGDSGSTTYFESAIPDVASNTPVPTDEQVAAAQNTDLAQAKALIANLKLGVLPYVTTSKTGFLNVQADKINAEVSPLSIGTTEAISSAGKIASIAAALADGSVLPSNCDPNPSIATEAVCFLGDSIVRVSMPIGSTGSWSSGPVTAQNQSDLTDTGTIAYSGGAVAMNGYLTMGASTHKLKVGLGSTSDSDMVTEKALMVSRHALGGDVYKYTISGTTTEMDGTSPVVEAILGTGSQLTNHEPSDILQFDASKVSLNLGGTFLTANYQLTGQIDLSKLTSAVRENQWICGGSLDANSNWVPYYCQNSWVDFTGGTAAFTGTISGIGLTGVDSDSGNDFDILIGTLNFTATPTTGYDPNESTAIDNMVKVVGTFSGTVKKSAADLGLNLVMTGATTAPDAGTLTVTYKDNNKGINITGTGNWDKAATGQSFDLNSSDGITIHLIQGTDSATIMKGTTELGTITRTGRVNFIDGTATSLM